ncbi:MAG: hypothetical protein LBG09_02940 [Puniceicoccales bacterium]|jgi:hypothetical protein|nr:hypothetical protein [Puniceicoccales bacterium]
MKKSLSLFEKFARMQTEKWLEETTIPITLEEIDAAVEREEAEENSPSLEELKRRVQSVIDDAEQFFAQFGLTPESQEELFRMPLIQQRLDEVVEGVAQEREELERNIGRPRNGWNPLPFEKWAETEKILKNLPQFKGEKIQEICAEGVFDRSAQEQIAAIQERLTAALVDVKKAVDEQREAIAQLPLPSPVKRETSSEKSPLILPDSQEKRPIDADFERHYAEQLSIVMPPNKNTPQTIPATDVAHSHQTEPNHCGAENASDLVVCAADGAENAQENAAVRAVEAIREDIEKMVAQRNGFPEAPSEKAPPEAEWLPAAVTEEMPKISRKPAAARPSQSVIISALKAKLQQGNEEKPAIVTENVDSGKPQKEPLVNFFAEVTLPRLPSEKKAKYQGNEEKSAAIAGNVDSGKPQKEPLVNFFAGVTLPGLPLSGKGLQPGEGKNVENAINTLASHRRQVGPRRFHL